MGMTVKRGLTPKISAPFTQEKRDNLYGARLKAIKDRLRGYTVEA